MAPPKNPPGPKGFLYRDDAASRPSLGRTTENNENPNSPQRLGSDTPGERATRIQALMQAIEDEELLMKFEETKRDRLRLQEQNEEFERERQPSKFRDIVANNLPAKKAPQVKPAINTSKPPAKLPAKPPAKSAPEPAIPENTHLLSVDEKAARSIFFNLTDIMKEARLCRYHWAAFYDYTSRTKTYPDEKTRKNKESGCAKAKCPYHHMMGTWPLWVWRYIPEKRFPMFVKGSRIIAENNGRTLDKSDEFIRSWMWEMKKEARESVDLEKLGLPAPHADAEKLSDSPNASTRTRPSSSKGENPKAEKIKIEKTNTEKTKTEKSRIENKTTKFRNVFGTKEPKPLDIKIVVPEPRYFYRVTRHNGKRTNMVREFERSKVETPSTVAKMWSTRRNMELLDWISDPPLGVDCRVYETRYERLADIIRHGWLAYPPFEPESRDMLLIRSKVIELRTPLEDIDFMYQPIAEAIWKDLIAERAEYTSGRRVSPEKLEFEDAKRKCETEDVVMELF
ncbi:hypothetical protein BLS_008426 [Venturia inaequalis]|uniref:Uncharacterized protein n=1 Tax=Venturia inaequalis TaxID=5025 RepID=A0A8H3VKG2_VENIN|nr:hypothetical protein BLS_008426 [Venturia inaequalis]KAE9990809.1 hypothetical protein EG327_000956 [Venturia inaequalis]RDI77156.1 Peptidyl-prolyl cis-trans isomerase-like 2 [Venturia inaequalis]